MVRFRPLRSDLIFLPFALFFFSLALGPMRRLPPTPGPTLHPEPPPNSSQPRRSPPPATLAFCFSRRAPPSRIHFPALERDRSPREATSSSFCQNFEGGGLPEQFVLPAAAAHHFKFSPIRLACGVTPPWPLRAPARWPWPRRRPSPGFQRVTRSKRSGGAHCAAAAP